MDYYSIKPDPKLGLCLGGGAGLGILHLGLFEAMEDLGIRPGVVTGTSSGAVLGAFYAAGKSAAEVRAIIQKFNWMRLVAPPISFRGIMSTQRMQTFFSETIPYKNIEDLPIRLKIAAVNLIDGTLVGFDEGPLAKCLAASSAVPGMFEPVRIHKDLFYDAGGIYNLPLELFEGEGVKRIIAGNTIGQYGLMSKPKTTKDVFYQAYLIRTMHLTAWRTGPKGWQGKKNEELILIDYHSGGANPTSIADTGTLIEETRQLSLDILKEII